MRGTLISIDAWSRATASRVTVRAGAARNSSTLGAGGQPWEPAISRRPRFSMQLADDDLTGGIMAATCEFAINATNLKRISDAMQLDWIGSNVTIYTGDGPTLADFRTEFVGRITSGSTNADTGIASLEAEVDQASLDVPLLTLAYGGGGGADGDTELRGNLMPAGFGSPVNVKPILINAVANIYQVDGYGNLLSIAGVYEDLASFGAASADYATYAALAAATLVEGQWATCIAGGYFRLGAPPQGVITCDPVCGSGLPGSMMVRWLRTHAGILAARVRQSDFDALTTAVQAVAGASPTCSYWTADEGNVLDLVQRMCASCNAVPLVLMNGTIGVSRVFGGAELLTLDRQSSTPQITAWQAQDPPIPWWRLRMIAAKSYYVNGPSEIDYEDDIRLMGSWSAGTEYRQGNVVTSLDGSQWLYTYPTATTGNSPPVYPTLTNTWWSNYTAPVDLSVITARIDKIVSDSFLSAGEKPAAKIEYDALASQVSALNARYVALGSPSDITTAYNTGNTGFNALGAYLGALVPDWTNAAVDTPIVPATYKLKWTDAYDKVAIFAAAITGRQGVAAVSVSALPEAVQIQANANGQPISGQLPVTITATATQGGVGVSITGITITTANGCTASVSGNVVSITAISSNAGDVTFKVTAAGQTITKQVTFTTVVQGGGGGGGGTSATITTTTAVASSSYTPQTGTITLVAPASGKIAVNLTGSYKCANGSSITLQTKIQWRLAAGTYADVTGSPQIGTSSDYVDVSGGEPPPYYRQTSGGIGTAGPYTLTGLTAGSTYEFRTQARINAGTATTTSSMSARLYAEQA